ncbi:MAG: rRNA ((2251)-2-O)-methyltransferase RlmB [Pseudomonadota bacterium]|jgi:23S rRNA (guanosine2251-2'-O)-methyltransferase
MSAARRVMGLHAVESALRHSASRIQSAWLETGRQVPRLEGLASQLAALGIDCQRVPRTRLDAMAEGGLHQGILLEMRQASELNERDLLDALDRGRDAVAEAWPPVYLALDHVQDPHNLGACLRTCDAAGVAGVIITRDQSVGLTPVVAKVACGAAETVPVYRVTNLVRTIELFKQYDFWVVGSAGEASGDLYQSRLEGPVLLVMGAEGKGMRRLTREHCDLLVRIPMAGSVSSLNLSVATGVMLYEMRRRVLSLQSPA